MDRAVIYDTHASTYLHFTQEESRVDRQAPDTADPHELAVATGCVSYIDPETGYTVFTELAHIERGYCCGSRCRHCPYGLAPLTTQDPAVRPPCAAVDG